MTFKTGENVTDIDFVLIKKITLTVYTKCEGNAWEVSAYVKTF